MKSGELKHKCKSSPVQSSTVQYSTVYYSGTGSKIYDCQQKGHSARLLDYYRGDSSGVSAHTCAHVGLLHPNLAKKKLQIHTYKTKVHTMLRPSSDGVIATTEALQHEHHIRSDVLILARHTKHDC